MLYFKERNSNSSVAQFGHAVSLLDIVCDTLSFVAIDMAYKLKYKDTDKKEDAYILLEDTILDMDDIKILGIFIHTNMYEKLSISTDGSFYDEQHNFVETPKGFTIDIEDQFAKELLIPINNLMVKTNYNISIKMVSKYIHNWIKSLDNETLINLMDIVKLITIDSGIYLS